MNIQTVPSKIIRVRIMEDGSSEAVFDGDGLLTAVDNGKDQSVQIRAGSDVFVVPMNDILRMVQKMKG